MNKKPNGLAVGLAAILLLIAAGSFAAADGITMREASLNPDGWVFEVNRDAAGNLFISDWIAQEIWRVQPAGAYTVYGGLPSTPNDAKPDANGDIWWTDFSTTFGRVNAAAKTVTTWDEVESLSLGGLAFDDAGRVWLSRSDWISGPALSRFDPAPGTTEQLCGYEWTGGASSNYLLYQAGYVWLGDQDNNRILRFDPRTNQVGSWQDPQESASPTALAMDGDGNLWWADTGWGALARLAPASGQVTIYPLPTGSRPETVVIVGDLIWYTEGDTGTVGVLDPAKATGNSTVMTTGTLSATTSCSTLGAGTTADVTASEGNLAWSDPTSLAPIMDSDGWRVYELAADAYPYGMADSAKSLWVADPFRQKLVRLSYQAQSKVYLPLVVR